MTHLAKGDEDLHDENGDHRWTATTANGSDVARHEARIAAHMEAHRFQPSEPEPGFDVMVTVVVVSEEVHDEVAAEEISGWSRDVPGIAVQARQLLDGILLTLPRRVEDGLEEARL